MGDDGGAFQGAGETPVAYGSLRFSCPLEPPPWVCPITLHINFRVVSFR